MPERDLGFAARISVDDKLMGNPQKQQDAKISGGIFAELAHHPTPSRQAHKYKWTDVQTKVHAEF
jgi:hypothetical protein